MWSRSSASTSSGFSVARQGRSFAFPHGVPLSSRCRVRARSAHATTARLLLLRRPQLRYHSVHSNALGRAVIECSIAVASAVGCSSQVSAVLGAHVGRRFQRLHLHIAVQLWLHSDSARAGRTIPGGFTFAPRFLVPFVSLPPACV